MLGNTVLELPPQKGNPRNSEGAFIELKDGRIMFIYSRFSGESNGDEAISQIAARYSYDGGHTWTEKDRILYQTSDFPEAMNIMSVSLLRMKDEAIGLFFLIRYGWLDTRLHLFRSYDEGETFGKPVCCVPTTGYFVTNNDRVIRTESGRILIPGNLHRYLGNEVQKHSDGWNIDGRAIGCFFYSDDDGKTWSSSPEYCQPAFTNTQTGLQETGILDMGNNIIWAWFRTDLGCQYQAWSYNNGLSWSSPVPSNFTSPASPMQVKRLIDGRLIAVWNPIPNYNGRKLSSAGWGRTPLALAVSNDNGISWSNIKYIEDESSDAGYCYPAFYEVSDGLLIAYCAGGSEDKICLAKLKIKHVKLSEIN
jgi:hypothetical protein